MWSNDVRDKHAKKNENPKESSLSCWRCGRVAQACYAWTHPKILIGNFNIQMFVLVEAHQNICWWRLKRSKTRTWINQLTFNVTHITLPSMMNDWLTTNFEEERSICLSKQTIDWIVLYIRLIICWKVQTNNSSIN